MRARLGIRPSAAAVAMAEAIMKDKKKICRGAYPRRVRINGLRRVRESGANALKESSSQRPGREHSLAKRRPR